MQRGEAVNKSAGFQDALLQAPALTGTTEWGVGEGSWQQNQVLSEPLDNL